MFLTLCFGCPVSIDLKGNCIGAAKYFTRQNIMMSFIPCIVDMLGDKIIYKKKKKLIKKKRIVLNSLNV